MPASSNESVAIVSESGLVDKLERGETALKPRMSALIIASHVKEGIEMGR